MGWTHAIRASSHAWLDAAVQARIARKTLQQPADGSTHWSCRKMAQALGLSKSTVQRVWAQMRLPILGSLRVLPVVTKKRTVEFDDRNPPGRRRLYGSQIFHRFPGRQSAQKNRHIRRRRSTRHQIRAALKKAIGLRMARSIRELLEEIAYEGYFAGLGCIPKPTMVNSLLDNGLRTRLSIRLVH